MKHSVNLFEGDIYKLIAELKKLPVSEKWLKFANEANVDAMLEKMQKGCPKLTAQYTEQAQTNPFTVGKQTAYEFATEGQMFDVATYLTGEPEYWLNEVETEGYKTARDLYINISIPASESRVKVFEKLIKVIEVIDQMEAAGQRLNIVLFACSTSGNNYDQNSDYTFTVTVKQASEPVNIEQLIYLIASPAIMRYAKLHLQNCYKGKGMKYDSSSNCDIESDMLNNEDIFYIPSIFFDKVRGHGTTYKNIDLVELYNLK